MSTTVEERRLGQPLYRLANPSTERPVERLSDELHIGNIASGVFSIGNGCVWGIQPGGTVTFSAFPVVVGCPDQIVVGTAGQTEVWVIIGPTKPESRAQQPSLGWDADFGSYVIQEDSGTQMVFATGRRDEFRRYAVAIDDGTPVTYDPLVFQEVPSYATGKISEVISIGTLLGATNDIPVAEVNVHRFQSIEDPELAETVITFYSGATEDKLIAFLPLLVEAIEAWKVRQCDDQARALAQSVRVDILPEKSHVGV